MLNPCHLHGGSSSLSLASLHSEASHCLHRAQLQPAVAGSSFLPGKRCAIRPRQDAVSRPRKLRSAVPRSSLDGLPGPFHNGPEIQHLAERIHSISQQAVQGSIFGEQILPVVQTLKESVSVLESSASMLAQKAANLSGNFVLDESKAGLVDAAELANAFISDFWNVISGFGASPTAEHLSHSAATLLQRLEMLSADFGSQMSHFVAEGPLDASAVSSSAEKISLSAGEMMVQVVTALGAPYGALTTELVPLNSPLVATVASSAVAGTALVLANTTASKDEFEEGEDLPLRYDPDAIEAYFKNRTSDIISRTFKVIHECFAFAASLLIDKSVGLDKENEKMRAAQLVDLIVRLGPTAIKIGQALSIRPDILPAVYLEELQKLQDRVPPFPNKEAQRLILEGLGRPAEEVYSDISTEPVAAASLGQVYKARLRETGEVVAVKVQRPGVLEGISRDLYLLRSAAKLAQSAPNVRSDLVALLDNWAYRFFDELDYVQEARNAERFADNMKTLPNIVVPRVYMKYTSRKVLTSAWIEGERLSESKAEDLLKLVKTALNCYLMQLLESGFLHADPHPGNLLRTPTGQLCVLDFGLMTEVTEDQRYTFIEYISHLLNSDYTRVAEDLVKLGFVPPELVDPEKTAAVVPQLSRVLGQLVQGGGARKVNVQQISDDLSKMSEDYVFVIPPYFALILRAFSLLEGIGLKADPDYAIVDDCYPYLSKRLITDDRPRTRAALKYFLYGGKNQLSVARVEDLISGFQTFRELTTLPAIANGKSSNRSFPPFDLAAKEVLLLLFAPEGSYIQELILTELVRAVDALSRNAMAELWQYFALRSFIPLPPALFAPKTWPIPLPGLLMGSSPVATLSKEDELSLEIVKRLWTLIEPQFRQGASVVEIAEATRSVMPLIPRLFPGMITTAQRFALMLLQRQVLRFADDLDGRKSVAEWDRDPAAFARRIRPIRVSLLPSQKSDRSSS